MDQLNFLDFVPADVRARVAQIQDPARWLLERKVEGYNAASEAPDGSGVDCPLCGNKGVVAVIPAGEDRMVIRDCACRPRRRTALQLKRCGMLERARAATLEAFRTDTPLRKRMKELTEEWLAAYCGPLSDTAQTSVSAPGAGVSVPDAPPSGIFSPDAPPSGIFSPDAPPGDLPAPGTPASGIFAAPLPWLAFCGQSGAGKTHLCTAAFVQAVERRGVEGEYMLWGPALREIKRDVFETGEALLDRYKRAPLLYIDDLFKGRTDIPLGDADLRIALELLDFRYSSRLPTILSTERTFPQLAALDEAIAGRLRERCGRFLVSITPEPGKNFRFGGQS